MPFGLQNRSARLQSLADVHLDLLVVGGGITGVATARDAALRGFKVACVEKVDFAYGTSSRSSKLIHGGLRYLEQANFRLVFEGTHERATLRTVAPHLVRPIPFLFPVYADAKRGIRVVGFGLWLYDTLAGKRRYGRHRRYSADALCELEPTLLTEELTGGAVYYDCMTDDARLAFENALSAHENGAVMLNYVSFEQAKRDKQGHIQGAVVKDLLSDREIQVRCKTLLHCAGPWTDRVLEKSGNGSGPMIRTTKGVHILFPHHRLPVEHAVVLTSVRDRRVVFAIPRGRVTLVGTTDTDYQGDLDAVHATGEDVDYLMETLNHFFPDLGLNGSDICSTYAGLRPLVRDDSESPYDVSREHTVVAPGDGTITISGGKYTTYRVMADDIIGAAMKDMNLPRSQRAKCRTRHAMLPGADGLRFPEGFQEAVGTLVAEGVSADVAHRLVHVYGARYSAVVAVGDMAPIIDGMPFVMAEIDYSVDEEAAHTLEDVLVRRLPIFYEAPDQGLECADRVAERMASKLGWSDDERRRRIQSYQDTVAASRRWRN